jgi:hypothetical protein
MVKFSGLNWISCTDPSASRDSGGLRTRRVHFLSEVAVGTDRETVLEEYWSRRTHDLRLDVCNPDRLFVSMPAEFGASDWT